MLIWLDAATSRVGAPNENYARELMELFTLGHGVADHGGHVAQPYTEVDVSEAARACTGWRPQVADGTSRFVARRHDAADKTIFGATGAWTIDDVVDLTVAHPACALHVVSRLVSRVGWTATPADGEVAELADAFATDLDIGALVRRIFMHPRFALHRRARRSYAPRSSTSSVRCGPLVPFVPRHLRTLRNLGQVPFLPPDVAGWPANGAWLSTSAAAARLEFAADLAGSVDLTSIADVAPAQRPDAVAHLLGIDGWSEPSVTALGRLGGDPHSLLTLALVSPEFVVA